MEYTDDHRLLLQTFLSRKFLSQTTLEQMVPRNRIARYVDAVNEKLKSMQLIIQEVKSEDGETFWGIVNQKKDALSEIATEYSKPQLDFFEAILDNIIRRGSVDYVAAMDTNVGLNRRAKDSTLKKLVDEAWLTQNARTLELGIRSQIGLRSYIEETYGTTEEPILIECVLCQEFVLKGECCTVAACPVRMHRHCSEKWFSTKPSKVCPTCGAPWA